MDYRDQLITGRIKKIYKNLIMDVILDEGALTVPAFCPETDCKNMLYAEHARVYLTKSADERRRVPYTCQMVNKGEGLVFVNYKYKNDLFAEAFRKGLLQEDFGGYRYLRGIEYGEELKRVNFELSNDHGDKAYVYVVNIYNKQNSNVVFPSFINFFEIEMYDEMKRMRMQGYETAVFLIVPRSDCLDAKFVWNQDPIAAAKIYDEVKNGLKFCCYGCNVDEKSVSIARRMKILY